MSLSELSRLTEGAGTDLGQAAGMLARLDPDAGGLPVDAPGRLGELARAMQAQVTAAIAARAREAAAHGARLVEVAAALREVAAGYADVDAEARRRQEGGA